MATKATDDDPIDDGPDPSVHKETVKEWVKEAFTEWAEENKPDPKKTERPKSILDGLFG